MSNSWPAVLVAGHRGISRVASAAIPAPRQAPPAWARGLLYLWADQAASPSTRDPSPGRPGRRVACQRGGRSIGPPKAPRRQRSVRCHGHGPGRGSWRRGTTNATHVGCPALNGDAAGLRSAGRARQQRSGLQIRTFEAVTEDKFPQEFNTNVLGPILTMQEAVKHFGPVSGSVINICSIVSSNPAQMSVVYSATKSALDSITRGLSRELGPRKIRVNSTNAGLTETEGVHGITGFLDGSEAK